MLNGGGADIGHVDGLPMPHETSLCAGRAPPMPQRTKNAPPPQPIKSLHKTHGIKTIFHINIIFVCFLRPGFPAKPNRRPRH
ncbi:MAG: hypothetical protein ACOYJQ_10660 [Pseudochelatococcus sp.]|jgi:hypothetical protein|uniref:hypothetical protein n=1 Tax=Pseudochelatococcus sp. TaxID=2020869 RepID=UPI003D8A4ADD